MVAQFEVVARKAMVGSNGMGKSPSRNRTKSKSGCRTCKIRRVKCDESRPACHKCVSTGRTCEGYGIWGGGGKAASSSTIGLYESKDCTLVPSYTAPSFSLAETKEEAGYFEWFKCRTATKFPGLFASSFWDTLLLQASANEPAVWHAVLALSSAHKGECLDGQIKVGKGGSLNEHEKFMLRQYSKAIRCLTQPGISAKARATLRIALVTCVVFVCLEILLGRYQTAQAHLENGLNLMNELEVSSFTMSHDSGDAMDDTIMDAFARIYTQAQLLVQPFQKPRICLPMSEIEFPSPTFKSLDQARQNLHRLLSHIFYLTEQAKQQGMVNSAGLSLDLVDRQRRIRVKLDSWLHICKASRANLLAQTQIRGAFTYEMLQLYHTMASVMAHACLSSTDEWIYDSHINDFVTMIMRSINIRRTFPTISEAMHGYDIGKSKTIMDMGWIPPLYYLAIKCRVHRVRLQAIKLLESTGPLHKEGIWDAEIAASVGRKVMEVEERYFYQGMHTDDDFEFCSPPKEQDFLLPVLPDAFRVHDVQVMLPNEPGGRIELSYMTKQEDGFSVVLTNVYDMISQKWIDGRESS